MTKSWIKPFFLVAALYEAVLGVAFFSAPGAIFEWFGVTPPNHMAYVQFPALLLIMFGVMFYRIAMDPVKNRELILYGCGLKVAYCSMTFGYALTSSIPSMWMPWAWADLVFLALFIVSWRSLGGQVSTA
ncbi:MAG: hypothetical protein V3S56_06895 [Gemmatimonadota bacterium]